LTFKDDEIKNALRSERQPQRSHIDLKKEARQKRVLANAEKLARLPDDELRKALREFYEFSADEAEEFIETRRKLGGS
jgi:hypothetical protein